jgi:hypothetical protein
MVPVNSFLEIQNFDFTQGGQGLFNILQTLLPQSHQLNTLNQQYLLITYSKTTNNYESKKHFNLLLTLDQNNDIEILLRYDIYIDEYIFLFKFSDNLIIPSYKWCCRNKCLYTFQKDEFPNLTFDFSQIDLLLLEKSRMYSKKFILKILFKWINLYLKSRIFVFEKIPSFFISRTNSYHSCFEFFYELFIGTPLILPLIYLETQILFTPLLIQNPNFIFLTFILETFTQYFHFLFYWNRNITTFQIPQSEYWIFIIMKYLNKGFYDNFWGLYIPTFLVVYLLLVFYYFLILNPLLSLLNSGENV